ncbi:Myosin head (motor domain) UBA TS N domain [Trypanosoma vivax]|uniref:Putative myosin heavy chain n=1 Tax=Trypanosoma vivax (strain Y486) TaxID=1055687 RepID=G0U9F2_TRYVY|nr:putative myosin heavy chain [Trypanosoma vivax]KAH8604997.1 Myosin head (motor domain) UBA TS N domain [Trypanosoma vivax]CCC54238.1 putative myosin heavy chain [Trypanosoma vivax Y486]
MSQGAERVLVGQQVYYLHHQRGWQRGVVASASTGGNSVQVRDAHAGGLVSISLACVHGYIESAFDSEDPNLFNISDLHVATVLHCLKERFEKLHQQYSLLGEMLLSVNPFRPMPFNSDENCEKYLSSAELPPLPPHIWHAAHRAHSHLLLGDLGNQSILVSGESGSGKTESTKMLVAYLGKKSCVRSSSDSEQRVARQIAENLKWSNPVLESFGNARTVRNDNSSRFGKYIKLYFDSTTGVMVGGETVTYLLERSRIVSQSGGERGYHIFYEMLAGLSKEEKAELGGLKKAQDYRCLNGGNTFVRRGVDGKTLNDADEFKFVRKALEHVGFTKSTQKSIFRVLASILHLLEIRFESDQNDKSYIVDEGPFYTSCRLLQVDPERLRDCFLVKSRSNIVTIFTNRTEAEGLCGAFCKAMYAGLFDRLLEVVNKSVIPPGDVNSYKYIGLLDIFGFEKFTHNSFEQLCINYANESLQNHYNKYTFINDEEECRSEGIDIPKVVFPDNSDCMNVFDQRKVGVFAMLDNECRFKAGSSEHFTQNLWHQWGNRGNVFLMPKSTVPNTFGIAHYAAKVYYNTEEWLEKNTDGFKRETYECVADSTDTFVRSLLSAEMISDQRKNTVVLSFQEQLVSLRTELELTETQFVRCIKPNSIANANLFDNAIVGSQLESAGVLQTIELKRGGYPVRRLVEGFCRHFYLIMPHSATTLFKRADYSGAACKLLEVYQRLYEWSKPNYAIGRRKVFLRAEVWASLERLCLRRRSWCLHRCGYTLRRWIFSHREERRKAEEQRKEEIRRAFAEREKIMSEVATKGLSEAQLEWIEELSLLFPLVDASLLVDIVIDVPKRSDSLRVLAEMEGQRLDNNSSLTFMRVVGESGLHSSSVQELLRCGINTVEKLNVCDQTVLRRCGLTEVEVATLIRRLLCEESTRTRLKDLEGTIGTAKFSAVFAAAKRRGVLQADHTTKLQKLVEMGFPEDEAVLALTHYSGDVEKAALRLVRGDVGKYLKRKPDAGEKGRWTSLDVEVQQLVKLGTTRENAKRALFCTKGNVNAATRLIFSTPVKGSAQ